MWHTRNKSKLCPLAAHNYKMGRENRQACPYTASKSADLSRKLSSNRNSRYHWRRSSGEYLALVCTRFVAYEWKSNFFVDLWHVWVYVGGLLVARWDLERHGIYMLSQLTTILYFEAFDGDSPKICLWVRIMLMSALSESLNAFGILVDLRNCPVACNDAEILPYFHINYWIQQSANKCCNLFVQIIMGGG